MMTCSASEKTICEDKQERAIGGRREWLFWLYAVAPLTLAYGLLHNGYWALGGGDDTLYLGTARSLASGKGFMFNGLPAVSIPPGCSLVLALAMKISPSFWFLNLLPLGLSIASMGVWYWVTRRFASPGRSMVIVWLTGTLLSVHWPACHFYSEPLFTLLLGVVLLLALQVREGATGGWRIATLAAGCAGLMLVRWAAMLVVPMVVGTILWGQLWPRWNRQWLAAALSVAVMMGMFVVLRATPWRSMLAWKAATTSQKASTAGTIPAGGAQVDPVESVSARPQTMKVPLNVPGRLAVSGEWVTKLLWPVGAVGTAWGMVRLVTNVIGWGLILLLVVTLVQGVREREWIWPGIVLYCAPLCATWGQPNERYFAPIAPLLLVGLWRGIDSVAGRLREKGWPAAGQAILPVFLAAVFSYNLLTLGVNIWAARAGDFYGTYHGGAYAELVAAAEYLNRNGVEDGEVAVNSTASTVDQVIPEHTFGLGAMHVLIDKRTRIVPGFVCTGLPNDALLAWAGQRGIRYYLCRLPASPWHIWHFRVGWLQERVTGTTVVPNPDWVLFDLGDGQARPVDLSTFRAAPRLLPGLQAGL